MKNILIVCLLFVGLAESAAQVSFGEPSLFNEGWKFILSDDPSMKDADYNDSRWRSLDLPHDWSIEGQLSPTLASCTGFLPGGIAWYRKTFTVSDGKPRHYIYFEGVYNRSEIYLNGHHIGGRPNGYVSFMCDMTPYLKEGENVLAVRVDHSRSADSRWYSGSGIYRDVWMISAPEVHLSQWGVGYWAENVMEKSADLYVEYAIDRHVETKDRLDVEVVVNDADGKVLSRKRSRLNRDKDTLCVKVASPHLWSLDDPYLHKLTVNLLRNGKKVDSYVTDLGFRRLEFDPDKGFALNGEWMKVKGVCLHHDAGVLGSVVPEDVWRRRLNTLKSIGVNAIRMSHNPQAPVVYSLCDELGLLVMDEGSDEWEFPKRKWVKGWNVGIPEYQGSYDFFEEWIEKDVTDMVRRDRNHPSVFLWSVGNEVDYPNDPYSHPVLDGSTISQPMFGGYKPDAPNAERIGHIAKRLAECIRAVDGSRPVTGALAGVVMSNETIYPDVVDVVGYNYTENRYDIDHRTYPDRIIYGSENRHDYKAWLAVRDNDFIFGQFLWTGADYLGESNSWPSRGLYSGLLDFGSFVKPRGWFRASLWSDKPVTYLGTYPFSDRLTYDAWDIWNYEDGQTIRAVCFTNAPYARLLLDGKVVGEMKPHDGQTGIIHWDIPYAHGELKAEGCDAHGNVLSDYVIKSSLRPYSLSVSVDKTVISGREVAHVLVEVLDENGVVVKLADNEITCTIDGPATLLGLEGSNNSDMSDYTDNTHRAYHGRLLAYISPGKGKGEAVLKFTSPLLKSSELTIVVE